MKKTIVTILAALASQSAFAADHFCGTNVEKVPGSHVYDKLVFWEKVDTSKPTTHFLLADGTLLRQQDLTPETVAKIVNGTLAMGFSFDPAGKPFVFLGRVQRNKLNEIKYENLAVSTSDSTNILLMANGASMMCKEM